MVAKDALWDKSIKTSSEIYIDAVNSDTTLMKLLVSLLFLDGQQ